MLFRSDRTYENNRRAAEIARVAAQKWSTESQPRFVAGSIGPGTRLPSLGHIDWDTLLAAYIPQVQGLVDGGADVLLIETCQDILQTKIALAAIKMVFDERKVRVPVMAQVTMETTGTMLLGSEIGAALVALAPLRIDAIGLNCATGPAEMSEHLRLLPPHSPIPLRVLPPPRLPPPTQAAA